MTIREIQTAIAYERDRQEIKHAALSCANPAGNLLHKLAVLTEETGEVAHAVLEHNACIDRARPLDALHQRDMLKAELIQTAAICQAWLESL